MAFSAAFILPIGASLLYDDGALLPFAFSAVADFALGLLLWRTARRHERELKSRDGYLLVALAWPLLAATAMLPLALALPGLSFSRAYFEAMSGITTSGATVLTNVDHLPQAVNLWRHELCWLGGLGIISLGMAVLPLLGIGGMQIYRAESTGPVKESKLTPRFVQTVRSLWLIYGGLTVACILALRLAGMNWFDAVCHAFSVLSLSGFSTHDASIGYFDSPLIELVLVVFMLLAGINFATHYLAWRRKSLRVYARDAEARAFLVLLLASCMGLALYVRLQGVYPDYWSALRHAGFNTIAVATGCGLFSADYDAWPLFAGLWMLLLSCLAASAGSTGGGIKMVRTLILFKQSSRELFGLVHPTAVHTLKVGGQVITARAALSVLSFVHLYTVTIVGLTLVLILSGMDVLSAFTAIIATINNGAHGLREVGPTHNFASLSDFQLWVCTFSMLAGRLELFVLIVPFTPAYWRE
ncbi:MAG: TrkH family potassium uptake protein [Nevskia sp.]|nr:TrkH family potassium uptake protein [Nevskia sp.]